MKPIFKPKLALILALPLALAAAPLSAQETPVPGGEMPVPGAVVLKDFVLTRAIEAREPIDMVEDFTLTDEMGYAFFRVYNEGPPVNMTAVWMYRGQTHATVDLTVGTAEGWRTWSSANLKPGDWSVQLRDDAGTILAERSFAVASEFAEDSALDAPGHGLTPAGNRFDDGAAQQAEDWPELEGSDYPQFESEEIDG